MGNENEDKRDMGKRKLGNKYTNKENMVRWVSG